MAWLRVCGMAALLACGSPSVANDASTSDATSSDVVTGNDGAPADVVTDGGSDAPSCPTSVPANLEDPSIASCTTIVYIAGGDNNTVTTSTDGVTWQSFEIHHITGDDYINYITVIDGVVTTTSLPGVYQSVDGAKTFALVSAIASSGFDTYGGQVNSGNKGLLLTDNEGTYVASADVNWVRQTPFPMDASADGFGGHYHGTAFGNGHYVAFQDSGKFREWDGMTFVDGTTSVVVADVAFGNGSFVGIGGGGTVTSTDALTWTVQPGFDGGAQPDVLLFDGTKFWAYNFYSPTAYSSPDGKAWSAMTLPGNVRVGAAAYYEGHYFGVGNVGSTSALLMSSDGLTWTMAYTNTASQTFNINGPRVGIGRILK